MSKDTANNVCVQKIEVPCCGGTAIKYMAVCRYNYAPLELGSEFHSLEGAVQAGREISKDRDIPLCCSCSLLGREETAGLKMF